MIKKSALKSSRKEYSDSIKIINSRPSHPSNQHSSDLSESEILAKFQNLDIEPIQNTTGDKFVIDEIMESNTSKTSYSSQFSDQKYQATEVQFAQSKVWPDIFYGKKKIINLLEQRNSVCQKYNLNSKSLKQSLSFASKRVYSDEQISHYVKQLFSQSPSYFDYDFMSFAIIPQVNLQTQKYFVFMSSDFKFFPQCKSCNFATHLILNVQKKSEKSPSIKGKIICSSKNCKKSILGEFIMSHNDLKLEKINNKTLIDKINTAYSSLKKIPSTQRKKQPELSERQKMVIKKAALKLAL